MYFAFPFAYYSRYFTVQKEWVTICATAKLSTSTTAVVQSAVSVSKNAFRLSSHEQVFYSTTNVSNGKNVFFQVWEDTVGRRRQALVP